MHEHQPGCARRYLGDRHRRPIPPRDVRADPDQVQRPAAGTGWRRQRHGLVLQDPDAGVLQRLAELVGGAAEGV
ncbi:MAG TPA: hypothetical protein VF468_07290 [Actinomycetota bacterium]|nr:hypothetical protein [Actinomycetota bacterium]